VHAREIGNAEVRRRKAAGVLRLELDVECLRLNRAGWISGCDGLDDFGEDLCAGVEV